MLTTPSTAAAVIKSRLKQTGSYDQKQTGQYNIRLHLKDFQIIALLNEDALGALNDVSVSCISNDILCNYVFKRGNFGDII